jgi:uncharacterized protein (DUF1330 family)
MPKGYVYAEIEVIDPVLWKTYPRLAAASIAEFGGRYLVTGRPPKYVPEGSERPQRMVILEFDSLERAIAWYNSPQYQAALRIRERCARSKVFMVAGGVETS